MKTSWARGLFVILVSRLWLSSWIAAAQSPREVLTQHNDNARTGAYLRETTLNTANVDASTFGQRYWRSVDEQIYAQPLFAEGVTVADGTTRNVVYVATMANSVFAFDADDTTRDPNGGVVWRRSFIRPPANTPPNGGFLRESRTIGIMSTPAIDRPNNTMYVAMAVRTDFYNGRAFWLVALDIGTGDELGAVQIDGRVTGLDGTLTVFRPESHLNRPGLLLSNGRVYVSFAGYEDTPPFHGWVMGYDANPATLSTATPTVYCSTPNRQAHPRRAGGGIWQSGNGLAADEQGDIYFMTGNGAGTDAPPRDNPVEQENSFVKLRASDQQLLRSWSPPNLPVIDTNDQDLGSSGVLLLPGSPPRLVGGGKTGVLYVLDRNLIPVQGFQAFVRSVEDDSGLPYCRRPAKETFQDRDGISFPTTYDSTDWACSPNIHGSPVVWRGADGVTRVYAWSEKDYLKAYTYLDTGRFNTTPVRGSVLANKGMPGGTLSLSANGSTQGTGIIWATIPEPLESRCVDSRTSDAGYPCDASRQVANGRLYAFDAETLDGETLHLLWDAYIPKYAKFTPPTVANGKVYVATFDGRLAVFGLHSPYAGWTDLEGAVASPASTFRPALAATPNGMDVFMRGINDTVWHREWNGADWRPWEDLGGGVASNPAGVPDNVFAWGVDQGRIYSRHRLEDGWDSWTVIRPELIASEPAAMVAEPGRIDVFVQKPNYTLAQAFFVGGSWGWRDDAIEATFRLPLAPNARPVTASWGPGHWSVFTRGPANNLVHFIWVMDHWELENLEGGATSEPAAAALGPGRLVGFALGDDQQVWDRSYSEGKWSAWDKTPFVGMKMADNTSPVAVSDGQTIDLFALSLDDCLQHIAWDGANWTWWEALGCGFTSAPAAVSSVRGVEVLVRASNGLLSHTYHPGQVIP